jgi:hypothetical protein
MRRATNWKDVLAASLFMAVGAAFVAEAYFRLPLGTARRMGPGYFPSLVGALVVALGLLLLILAIGRKPSTLRGAPWRAIAAIGLAPIAFAAAVGPLGLVPATAGAAMVSAFASQKTTLPQAVSITFCLALFCAVLFNGALGLQVPLFGGTLEGSR